MVKIITFRDFYIIVDNKSIIGEIGNNQEIIKLLKYFLIHRGMKLLPEKIIEDLWMDEDRNKSKTMLKKQINKLKEIIPLNNMDGKVFFSIDFINGYYLFTLEEGCAIEIVDFEKLLENDCIYLKNPKNKSPSKIDEICLPCKKNFLTENKDLDCLTPIKSKDKRFYLKNYRII